MRFAEAEDDRVMRATHSLDLKLDKESARPNTSYGQTGAATRSASS